jgi:hypothetical protein
MVSNELFRMVSLRQSKRSVGDDRPEEPRPDPRLRHRGIIERQAKVEASPRETMLRELKSRYADMANKVTQLESVQRAVFRAYTLEQKDEAAPKSTGLSLPSLRRSAPAAAAGALTSTGSVAMSRGFAENVSAHLNEPEKAIFNDAATTFTAHPVVLGDWLNVLSTSGLVVALNNLCAQISAIEEGDGEALPTVTPQADTTQEPIVTSVGWGDLVLAREMLVGYTAREIAHIENILPGETKLREHERLSKTEEVQETEVITEKETEKDSQTTDRYELQSDSQEAINRYFSVSAGVNTSGRYGLTEVNTTLDTAFSQSQSQSRSNSVNTAREIVTKAVERTFERVRQLRRLTITEEIRELNQHELTNVGGSQPPQAVSGMYLWVEKIQKVELRHYGTRMMLEFHVPEPAVSLLERATSRSTRKRLPPFDVSPSQIHAGNYMCLAQRYGALDVEPPPSQFIEVGFGWTSSTNEDADAWGEDQFTAMISIPEGYRPEFAKVMWSGLVSTKESRAFDFSFAVGGRSELVPYPNADGAVFRDLSGKEWPQGVPISGRLHGAWDGAMYVQALLPCVRTAEALDRWRLRIWEALRAGYEVMQRKLSQEEEIATISGNLLGPVIADRAAAENRRIERGELQKWSIKAMRRVPQNFNAIEQVGLFQEMSPTYADAQAPIVRFYEDAFEWEHMTYFLYPYHWARRASWRMRTAVEAVDPKFRAFLEAGAARVIVPVVPGYEDKVLAFLDPSQAGASELDRILAQPPPAPPASNNSAFRDVWIELLTEHKPDLAHGSGTLAVVNGSADVRINDDSNWRASAPRDVGREIYIAGERYEIAAVVSEDTIQLDRPYQGATKGEAYAAGSVPFGPPWTVNVPTSLIVLADNVPALRSI